jgi:hypothetical protein
MTPSIDILNTPLHNYKALDCASRQGACANMGVPVSARAQSDMKANVVHEFTDPFTLHRTM